MIPSACEGQAGLFTCNIPLDRLGVFHEYMKYKNRRTNLNTLVRNPKYGVQGENDGLSRDFVFWTYLGGFLERATIVLDRTDGTKSKFALRRLADTCNSEEPVEYAIYDRQRGLASTFCARTRYQGSRKDQPFFGKTAVFVRTNLLSRRSSMSYTSSI